ncbi:MAG: phage tail sheath subtilisin-like domain-containing protein [Deltaproteobacteria bacterium]|nr:phage tail sheath subtilisin-like domain-containing protein [Deltaproteobacteria bacterium]
MATYKTPDVYVEEISLFPPSVAEVETAVPAFIGYTEKADEFGPGDLENVPTKVTSLLEYEELFGGAPPMTVTEIILDENNVVSSSKLSSNFYMYDSLRLFFKNGGGKCYIISVGSYSDTLTKSHFDDTTGGLSKLKKVDEPTIILFPDAVLFESNDLYDLQQQALKQCNELQDRFGVFDLLESKAADATFDWEDGVNGFRNNIGINYLKYGAAYTPWLKSNLGMNISYRDVKGKIFRGGNVVTLGVLTDDNDVKTIVTNLDNAIADVGKIDGDLDTLNGTESTLKAKYITLLDAFKSTPAAASFKALFNFIYDIVNEVDEWGGTSAPVTGADLKTDIGNLITNSLKASMSTLIGYDKGADSELTGSYNLYETYHPVEASQWDNIFDKTHADNPAADTSIFTGADNTAKMKSAEPSISQIFDQVNAAVAQIVSSAANYESTFESSLYDSHTVYKSMITKLSNSLTTLPPSGAIAGIYAMVDSNRGVWKAPANVSLSGVVGVTETIDSNEQEDLNVDVVAGKSINAIRAFTGKGTLVWGARTLAGNDNEWRYVPVRRFFNMVEESIKKSTYWAVFEPNDANTWIKVKSMIENYLTQKWREGALAGSKPDEAFFVKVGLGATMTAQDILEGRMNVEIGMAVVRPAEFIILKFSHKMQES